MKTRSLSKRQSNNPANAFSVWKMQDSYLDMMTGQLFEYMRKKYGDMPDITDMIPNKDTGNEVIGKTIQLSVERMEDELNLENYEEAHNESDMLFALLVLPFIGFVMDAGDMPEQSIIEEGSKEAL